METKETFSRASLKITSAAKSLKVDFKDKTVLDIGSSTGGFTDFALKNGAAKVIAVEKGTNQMKSPLRFNPKIELHEKTDIFNFKTTETIDLILADVSFLSLTDILEYARLNLSGRNTQLFVMLKPQFEAHPNDLVNGIIKNNKIRRRIITDFETKIRRHFHILGKKDNETPGKNGNIERFYLLKVLQ
jgi:23S rRNA (cytidine1920-2'-O)/16S rRNA (cytidine1409-2'-O)-methyltransferase